MMEFYAARERYDHAISLRIAYTGDGGKLFAEAIPFSPIKPGEYVDPTLRLQPEEAQRLMDELWTCGLRPTEGSGSAGAMSATQKHLADMQLIAMSALEAAGVKLKG
jgi:hypothetical protein